MLTAIYDFWFAAFQAEQTSGSEGWAHSFSFLNLFQYVTFRAATAGLLSFGLSLLIGPHIIRKLISLKVGQPIRTAEEVHKLAELHGGKVGTPTMGGVLIIATVLISTLVCARIFNPFVVVCACTMAACGLLGFHELVLVHRAMHVLAPRWSTHATRPQALHAFAKPYDVLERCESCCMNTKVWRIIVSHAFKRGLIGNSRRNCA